MKNIVGSPLQILFPFSSFNVGKKNLTLYLSLMFMLLLVFADMNLFAQTTYFSRSPGGNWNSNTTWSTVAFDDPTNAGTSPVAGDIVFIGGSGSIVTITGAAAFCATLTIDNGSTLNINNAISVLAPGTTTVNGTVAINTGPGTKIFGGLVTIGGTGVWNETNSEPFVFRGGITNNGSFTANVGAHTFNTSSQTLTGNFAIPNITVTGGAVVLTNTNTLTVNSSLNGSGRITQGSGATLNLGGASAITNMTATASGNTVNYTGIAQTIHSNAYDNLGLSGSGIKTLQVGTTTITGDLILSGTVSITGVAGMTIGGDVNIGSGTSFTLGAFTHNVGGDFTNNGTFTGTGSTLIFNGAAQNITGGSTTFNDVTLSGSGTKTLGVNTTIGGLLSINNGTNASLSNANVYTSNSLILGGAIQQSGTWGSTSSAAANQNNTFFSGTGLVTVATGANSYYSIADGPWNVNTTWSNTGFGGLASAGTPGPGDYVFIGRVGVGSRVVTITGAETCEALFFDAGTSVTNTLTISSGSLAVVGAVTIPQTVTSGSNILNVGAGTLTASDIDFTSIPSGAGHQMIISTGIATVSGDVTGIGTSSTIQFTGAGLLQLGGSFYTAANGTLTTVAGSTVEYTGAAQTVQAHVYNNLTLSGTGNKTMGNSFTMTGNLAVNNNATFVIGGFQLVVTGSTNVATGGTLSINNNANTKTFIGLVTIASGGTWTNTTEGVTFRGGITNNGTFTAGTGLYSFTTNSQALTGIFTIPSVTVLGGAIVLTNNTSLTVNTSLGGTGRITQGAGATLNIGGTSAITNMTATASGNTVNYTGAAQTVHSNAYDNLGLSGSGVKTLQAGTTAITGDLILSGTVSTTGVVGLTIGGDVNIGLGTSFTSGAFTHNVAGDWTNIGTFIGTASGGINLNGAGQNITGGSTTFNDLVLSGSGTKVFGVSTTIVAGLSINTGVVADLGTFTTHTANTLTLSGALQSTTGIWGGTASTSPPASTNDTYFLSTSIGEIAIAVGGNTFYSIADGPWNDPNTWSNTGFGGLAAAGTPVAGDYVYIGRVGVGSRVVTIAGTETCSELFFDAGTSVTNTLTISSGSLAVSGTVTIPQTVTSGSNILNVGAGTLTAGDIDFTSTPGGAGHLITISTGTATVTGNITGIGASSTIQFTGAGLLQLGGSFYTAANGTLTTVAGSTVEYTGAAQTVQAHVYNNLTLSGTGNKTMGNSFTMTGNLAVNNNATFVIGGFQLVVTGSTNVATGGTLSINNNANTKTFIGLVTIASGGTWTNTTEAVTFRGGITNNGTFTAGTGVYTFNTNSQILTGTFSIPSVTVTGAAVTMTNTNILTVNTALSGTGGIIQSAGATLSMGGTSAITNMTATASGNTVNYTGAAQTVHSNAYDNLGLSGSGVKTLQVGTTAITGDLILSGTVSATCVTGLTIGGDVNIGVGTSFTSGAFTHSVAGNWTNDGTFTHSLGTISFNGGTTAQTISGSSNTVFNNLSVTNTNVAGVTLNSDQSLFGVLSFSPSSVFNANDNLTLLSTSNSHAAGIADLTGITFNGNVTVQRSFGIADNFDRFISAPVSNATVSQLQAATPAGSFPVTGSFTGTSYPCTGCINNGHNFRYYQEASSGVISKGYQSWITSNSNTLVPGVGYDAYMWNGVSNTTVSFNGTINQGDINLGIVTGPPSNSITHTSNASSADGWNLIGNPYPSAIQWNNDPGSWTRTNIDPTVWVWDVVGRVWHSYNANTSLGDLTNGVIASGQGFWVYAPTPGAATITVKEPAKSAAGSGIYYRTASSSLTSLTVSLSRDGVEDNAFLLIDQNATQEFDYGLDARKMELGIEKQSVSLKDSKGDKLGHYAVNAIKDGEEIPISISADTEGEFMLHVKATSGFPGFEDYILVDSYLGKYSKISDGPYHFAFNPKTQQDRFFLTRNSGGREDGNFKLVLNCYPNPATDHLTVEVNSESVEGIVLMDNMGKVLTKTSFHSSLGITKADVKMTEYQGGIYILKVIAGGKTYFQRVVKI